MFKRVLWFTLLCSSTLVVASSSSVELVLKDIHGKQHRLSDYRGKWVVVNYWATWCPPCLDEIPELSDFHDKYKGRDAVVLGINHEEVDPAYLKTFVEEYLISYPVLRGEPGTASPFGRIHGLPSTFIVSPQGVVVSHKVGSVTQLQLEEMLNQQRKKLTGNKKA